MADNPYDPLDSSYRLPPDADPLSALTEATTIIVNPDDDGVTVIDPASGASQTEHDDGSLTIDLDPKPERKGGGLETDFDANLAEFIDSGELGRISNLLLEAIEADEQSRREWLETRAKGIAMLGFRIEEPKGDVGASASPVEGMSTVRDPLLAEAVIRFQSNAAAELLPAAGPVKVRNDSVVAPDGLSVAIPTPPQPGQSGHNGGPPLDDGDDLSEPMGILQRLKRGIAGFMSDASASDEDESDAEPDPDTNPDPILRGVTTDELAEALEKDMNHYLTAVDKGYRSDTNRMLFWVGFGGSGFKKVYHDPIRRMPISRSVEASDLIVNNAEQDLADCGRITHKIKMRRSILARMKIAGVYRDIGTLTQPNQDTPNAVDEATALAQGFNPRPQRPEDNEYTVYECYTELNVSGYEHTDEDGEKTGLELPYRVTIEKDSRQILEIRRNWRQDDQNCLAKKTFVRYPFIEAMGFYCIGLLQVLGNTERALTAAIRLMLDTGMFANFPGFLYSDAAGRQATNEFRVPPGGGQKINTGGKAIQDVVMALPYKDVGNGLLALTKLIQEGGQRIGGTAELQVAEGNQEAPVGTTLAMIEQANKMLAAVHIGLHVAQSEEFQLLKELFREDPEALWRYSKRPARKWEREEFLAALDDCELVPAADPNIPSHMHRIMKAMALAQMALAAPGLFDQRAVTDRVMHMMGINSDGLLLPPAPPGPPPPDPKMMEVQLKAQQAQQQGQQKLLEAAADAKSAQAAESARLQEVQTESADRAADRISREKVALIRDHTQKIKTMAEAARDGMVPPTAVNAIMDAPPVPGMPQPQNMPQFNSPPPDKPEGGGI